MAVIETTIEIDRTPQEVRAVVLDFDKLHEWHSAFLQLLKPLPEGTSPYAMKAGDDMKLKFLNGPAMKCKCHTNDETGLAWEGGPGLLFHGIHSIKFEAIDRGKRTKVIHGETFTGLFGQGVGLPGIHGQVEKLYTGYNRDLKKRCEGTASTAEAKM